MSLIAATGGIGGAVFHGGIGGIIGSCVVGAVVAELGLRGSIDRAMQGWGAQAEE